MTRIIRIRLAIALLTVLFTVATGFAQKHSPVAPVSPVTAKLVVPDTTILPGVPFDMWIELFNDSDIVVGVGLCADMEVRPENGDSSTFGGEGGQPYPALLPAQSAYDRDVRYVELRPHERLTLAAPIFENLTDPYFMDWRLSGPGTYSIRLRLDYCWGPMIVPQRSLLPALFQGALTTNEVTVVRFAGTASDASVWQWMQSTATNGKWVSSQWNEQVSRTVIQKYPDSNYYPYALLASWDVQDEKMLERYRDAIRRFPSSPVVELLLYEAYKTAVHLALPSRAAEHYKDLQRSKRPTTRALVFGSERPDEPCPPKTECAD